MSKILIVDDSAFQRKILKDMIEELGHEVAQANTGSAAIQSIENDNIDLICLDLLMPEVTGQEVLKYFYNKDNTPPIIVISADIQTKIKEQCLELGAAAFINKYINKEELESQLNLLLK